MLSCRDIYLMIWPSRPLPYAVSLIVPKIRYGVVVSCRATLPPHQSILPRTPHNLQALTSSSCRTPPPFLLFNMSPSGNGASVPLDCPQCGQSFRRREHLSRHLDRHSGARAYACSICKKSFPRRCAIPPFRHRSGYLLPMRAPTNELA